MEEVAVQSTQQGQAPVTDSAQAPAAATAQQGYTGNTAPAPDAQQQAAAPAPDPTKDSPQSDDKAAQRVADAQKAMHAATQRAAQLEGQLAQILNHPLLGPVVQRAMEPAQAQGAEDPVAKAYQEYQQAPNDQAAFAKLIEFSKEQAKADIKAELGRQALAAEEARRKSQKEALIVQTINKRVTELAPEIPLEFFWSMTSKAAAETPPELLQNEARALEWQVNRTIEMSRAVLSQAWAPRQMAQQQAQAVAQTAQVMMPSGGAAPQAANGAPTTTVRTFVDAVKESQRGGWGR